jgi:hypothetical protein
LSELIRLAQLNAERGGRPLAAVPALEHGGVTRLQFGYTGEDRACALAVTAARAARDERTLANRSPRLFPDGMPRVVPYCNEAPCGR